MGTAWITCDTCGSVYAESDGGGPTCPACQRSANERTHYAVYDDCTDRWDMLGWFDTPAEAWNAAGDMVGHDDFKLYSLADTSTEVSD